MSEIVDVGMEGIYNGLISAEFGEGLLTLVVSKYVDAFIGAESVEDKVAQIERAISTINSRLDRLEQVIRREALRDYLDQVIEGRTRSAPILGTMRTLMSLLRQGERQGGFPRPNEVDAALIDMENELNTLADENIYTFTVFGGAADETRFDPRFTLPFYVQGMNFYLATLARFFPTRLAEQRIRELTLFHAGHLEHFVSIMKSQVACTAEAITAEEPRRIPGTQLTQYVELLVVRNVAQCKADGYLNRRIPTGWRANFEPRIPGLFSVRSYNETRHEHWTDADRNRLFAFVQSQIPAILRLNEYRRLGFDEMLENATNWRLVVTNAATPHPLGLSVRWENGRGIVIRFASGGFATTSPIRLYRHPDYTDEDGRSLPVNLPVEILDPFPFEQNQEFTYEVVVWSDHTLNNRLYQLATDRMRFRHPQIVFVQDWRTRDEVLAGRPDMVDIPSAQELGLAVNFVVVQSRDHALREVVDIQPPIGTAVLPGTVMQVTVNDG